MISMLGPAPILDFDGTIARLDVNWDHLRGCLDVDRIDDLWMRTGEGVFVAVTAAEVEAAAHSDGIPEVLDALADVEAFAVLTSNSDMAVNRFFDTRPSLRRRLALVVGRETLGGPKTDFARFQSGFSRCAHATGQPRREGPLIYVGDSTYELDFARHLGATAISVGELTRKGNAL